MMGLFYSYWIRQSQSDRTVCITTLACNLSFSFGCVGNVIGWPLRYTLGDRNNYNMAKEGASTGAEAVPKLNYWYKPALYWINVCLMV